MRRRTAPLSSPQRGDEGFSESKAKAKARRRKWSFSNWLTGGEAAPLSSLPSLELSSHQTLRYQRAFAQRGDELSARQFTPLLRGSGERVSSTKRSDIACMLFPDLSPKDAGIKVAGDIMNNYNLRRKMFSLGYIPKKVGYTQEQIAVLKKFYNKA